MGLFGYLSMFPLAVLASWAFATLLRNHPDFQAAAEQALAEALTVDGLLAPTDSLDLDALAQNAGSAGVVGLLGLLFAGVGWIDSTIEGSPTHAGRHAAAASLPGAASGGRAVARRSGDRVDHCARADAARELVRAVDGRAAQRQLAAPSGTSDVVANASSALLVLLVLVGLFGFAWNRPSRRWSAVVLGSLMAMVGIAVLGSSLSCSSVGR